MPPGDSASPPEVTRCSSVPCRPHTPWYDGVNECAFVSIVQTRPAPIFGRPVHRRGRPHRLRPGTSPHALQIPSCGGLLDGHPALRSTTNVLRPARHYPRFWIWRSSFERQRDFDPPEQRAAQQHYGTVRLLLYVHVRSLVYGLRGPVLIARPRRAGDLPVLVHVVSQRARVLRLRRIERPLAIAWLPCCLPPYRNGVGILIHRLFEAQ